MDKIIPPLRRSGFEFYLNAFVTVILRNLSILVEYMITCTDDVHLGLLNASIRPKSIVSAY